MRPAQPVGVAALCAAFCHSSCWSGCENKICGSGLPGLVLRTRERLHQRAHVGHESRILAIEERLNVGQVRVQSEVRRGGKRQQRILRQRQIAAER